MNMEKCKKQDKFLWALDTQKFYLVGHKCLWNLLVQIPLESIFHLSEILQTANIIRSPLGDIRNFSWGLLIYSNFQ